MKLRVIDIETTGSSPPAEIIEVGCVDVTLEEGTWAVGRPQSSLFRPARGLTVETMAVHHITEEDFGPETVVCTPAHLQSEILGDAVDALVAHNCDFERSFISEAITGRVPWICTYKVALRAWPDAPRHSNQVLRYWRELRLPAELAMPPHRAGPDAYVTAHLLQHLLSFATVDEMLTWTREPRCYPTINFGKHRGTRWADVPADYLQWMVRQSDMDADAVFCAESELRRRAVPA